MFILIAIGNAALRPEATHAAAATGAELVDTDDPRDIARLASHAAAIVTDAVCADHIASLEHPGVPVFFVDADPGPINYEKAMRVAAKQAFGVPSQSRDLLVALGQAVRNPADETAATNGDHVVVGVVGATGGVGASTVAAATARRAAARISDPVTLVDAVDNSGGLDLLLGVEEVPGARWPDLQLGRSTPKSADVVAALPSSVDGVAVLSTARSTVADPFTLTVSHVAGMLDCLRSGPGVTVVDVPRAAIPDACDHVVVVTAAEVRSTAAATQLCAKLFANRVPYSLIVSHRGWSGLSVDDVEKLVHCDAIAEISYSRRLSRALEVSGLPAALPKTLAFAADAVLDAAQGVMAYAR